MQLEFGLLQAKKLLANQPVAFLPVLFAYFAYVNS
jgi:hypothetical protein